MGSWGQWEPHLPSLGAWGRAQPTGSKPPASTGVTRSHLLWVKNNFFLSSSLGENPHLVFCHVFRCLGLFFGNVTVEDWN